jgi:UDP-3-O-[3-hydroxymyristoyl] glucosamine N-acyltransferase
MMHVRELFDLEADSHAGVFPSGDGPVWAALDRLPEHLESCFQGRWPLAGTTGLIDRLLVIWNGDLRDDLVLRPTGKKGKLQAFHGEEHAEGAAIIMAGAYLNDDRVILGPGTVVEPGAMLKGPFVVGRDTEIRQGAYVRGTCLVGDGCVVGHTTEVKGSIMLDGAKAGHFAYIGDSILGRGVNLGAGTKLANLKVIPGDVTIRTEGQTVRTGRRKLGAILGDGTEAGCNSVTSPGTIIGPRSIIYPCVAVPSGVYPAHTLIRPARNALSIQTMG